MWAWLTAFYSLLKWQEKISMDLTRLETRIAAIEAVIPNIQSDYANLAAEIEALRAQIDPTAQARLDNLVARLGVSVGALTTLDESVPPPPPPGTPA
jgi:uncharacterized coiled-coil protein SlyX